ncbi:WhiB family transcriptional regulator [Streptomyces tauricus]|uniref:WhiB family transcriptional regulator n=1 Tax=Streptomyces tauricus TaxID=68274 RepID=UPI00387F29ED
MSKTRASQGFTLEPARAWLTQARCAAPDMARFRHLFFPHPGEVAKAEAAKEICGMCPVRAECLDDALAMEGGRTKANRFGVRGGKTSGQRYSLYTAARKRRQKQQASA